MEPPARRNAARRLRLAGLLAAAAAAAILAGCGGSSGGDSSVTKASSGGTTSTASGKKFYLVSQGCPSDPFWAQVNDGAKSAASDLGVHLVISEPTTCGSAAAENTLLGSAVAGRPAGIAVSIIDPTSFSENLQRAKQQGIPVVALNTAPPDRTKNPYLSYIGQQEVNAGLAAGKQAVDMFGLGSGDHVAVIDHFPSCQCLIDRFNGINKSLKTVGASATNINSTTNPSKGINIVAAYLKQHPDTKAVISLGPIATAQAAGALRQQNQLGKTPVGSFDIDKLTYNYMKQGDIKFTIDQQPFLQGYYSVAELYLRTVKSTAPVDIPTGPTVRTTADLSVLAAEAGVTE